MLSTGQLGTSLLPGDGAGVTAYPGTGAVAENFVLAGTGTATGEYSGTGSVVATFALAGAGVVIESYSGTGSISGTGSFSGAGTVIESFVATGAIAATFSLAGAGTWAASGSDVIIATVQAAPVRSQADVPSTFRVVSAVAVLNADGSVLDYLTDIMAGGTVTLDTTAEVLATCSFQCLDPAGLLTPLVSGGGQLNPEGVELQIFAGYDINGDVTLFSQGIFGVQECDAVSGSGTTSPGPVLSVTGNDRAFRVSAAQFTDALSVAAGGTVAEGVLAILAAQAPWCTRTNIAPSASTIAAQAFQPGDDPWAAIQKICASAGQLAFFDAHGVFCVIDDPSANPTKPVVTFIDGPGQLATSVSRVTSNSPGYNGVVVVGQALGNSSAVISGSAFDLNPASRTYALGPYGKRPAPPVQVSTVSTDADAAKMAQALLPQVLGMTLQTVVDCVPLFFLRAYDLFYVQNRATQTREVAILEQATIPLDYSTLESLTGVPLGTPIGQFDGLSNTPSVAAYAPVSTGAFAYNPTTGTYTYAPTTGGLGGLGLGLGGLGGLGGGGGLGVFGGTFGGAGIIRRVLRDGNGQITTTRDAQGIETVARETA